LRTAAGIRVLMTLNPFARSATCERLGAQIIDGLLPGALVLNNGRLMLFPVFRVKGGAINDLTVTTSVPSVPFIPPGAAASCAQEFHACGARHVRCGIRSMPSSK
jgi:hypothetical protein